MKFDLKKLIGLLGKLRLCVKKQAVLVMEVTDDATDKKIEQIAEKIDDIIESTLAVMGVVDVVTSAPESVKPELTLPASPIPEQDEEKEQE